MSTPSSSHTVSPLTVLKKVKKAENELLSAGTAESKATKAPTDEDDIKTTDGVARYMAYIGRIPRAIRASVRYMAYTSDLGEAFRPVIHPKLVKAAYGASWLYVAGDVAWEGYKEQQRGSSSSVVSYTVFKRAVFQAIASMAIPAFIIHTQVRIFSQVFKRLGRFQKWGPTTSGLLLIPALPLFVDEPVEHVLDKTFDLVLPPPKELSHKAHSH